MQRTFAISWLTLKAALRYRLVLVLSVVLLGSVVLLPMIIKDDGTAQGLTQILLTYTLSLITALLGFTTLWLACGTLAREVEEAQMQMIAVKPIARWQIWLGKWLGICILNVGLLSLSAIAVYVLLQVRASKLSPGERQILRTSVMVARGSAKEPPMDYSKDVAAVLKARLKDHPELASEPNLPKMAEERVRAAHQIVPPDYRREWTIDLGWRAKYLRDKPLFLRTRFVAAEYSEGKNYVGLWEIGDPNSNTVYHAEPMSMAAETFQEFRIPGGLIETNGILRINFINRNQVALLFEDANGMEVLYPEGSFALNFARGVGIIFCWLALFAAMGLACASFLSFPVAAFCSLGLLFIGLSTGTLKQIVDEGGIMGVNHETGVTDNPSAIDRGAVPMARALLWVFNLVRGFSPIDALSSGRSISWPELGWAIGQIVIVMSGLIAAIGISIFTRRELATAQSSH